MIVELLLISQMKDGKSFNKENCLKCDKITNMWFFHRYISVIKKVIKAKGGSCEVLSLTLFLQT